MKVRIKKLHPDAVIPIYAKHGDAGMDLTATSMTIDKEGNIVYGTGLAFEIPDGYVGLVFPRSSICKKDLSLSNAVGVVDSGYRGEVMAKFKPTLMVAHDDCAIGIRENYFIYGLGDRIAQMIIVPYPHIEFEESDELTETERGEGGYGSTGV